MDKINFDNKTFILVENSKKGEVTSQTQFHYKQVGSLVTADYYGGAIKYGKIIAFQKGNKLEMLYQCATKDDELKAGKAIAAISTSSLGKIRLSLKWQRMTGSKEEGLSEYMEI